MNIHRKRAHKKIINCKRYIEISTKFEIIRLAHHLVSVVSNDSLFHLIRLKYHLKSKEKRRKN
jgi:hypothetical protein